MECFALSPATKNKNFKLKRKFFDFNQKKETRRKGINASQLAMVNFSDITGKHMNAPCGWYFYVVFSKNENISSTLFAESKHFLLFSLWKHTFFLYSPLM